MKVEFDLLKLLSSRLCHDVISPVNSLHFSMDIIKDDKNMEHKEALDIATSSINNLINRLSYFRMTLGAANLGEGASGLSKAKELVMKLFQEKDVKITWDKEVDENLLSVSNNDNLKLLLNLFLIIFYAVHKSAQINIFVQDMNDSVGLAILTKGSGIKLGIDNIQALRLECKEKDITPRNIQSYFTAVLADQIDANLEVRDNMQEEIQMACKLKKN